MTRTYKVSLLFFLLSFAFLHSHTMQAQSYKQTEKEVKKVLLNYKLPLKDWNHIGEFELQSLRYNAKAKSLSLYYNDELSYLPWREDNVQALCDSISLQVKPVADVSSLRIFTNGHELKELIPNAYRTKGNIDSKRLSAQKNTSAYIRSLNKESYANGLSTNHIALWHSHGWHYEPKLDRWEWQRARLFGTVEDIFPMTYVLPYLVPMLENAGANVFLPRERSFQTNELIIDNDSSSDLCKLELSKNVKVKQELGFAMKDTLYPSDNPFVSGTSFFIKNAKGKVAEYIFTVPKDGKYPVYVSYQQNSKNASEVSYTVNHSGGKSSFLLNQTIGGSTWAYLGSFYFVAGEKASVELAATGQVSMDAVRVGGGIGSVVRSRIKDDTPQTPWQLSGKPRYMEAARYYLQYAGMPDTLVYSFTDEGNDYKDDYQCRGEWLNYLMGKPNGPESNRKVEGLKLPIDLALAFHTDAGVTTNDSVIGTLGIYSTNKDGEFFNNGQSKMTSRDLSDIVQSQVVNDIRKLYNPNWIRRGMWDKKYSEAWRPNVPTMLLELLSHQNLSDMRLALDPNFKFDVSRAVYKGILRYLAYQHKRDFIVQPLPVDHLAITESNDGFQLSWKAVVDSLEETAVPDKYKVYSRRGSRGFDNGTIVNDTLYRLPKAIDGQIMGYKVTAINGGGESMDSEILSLGIVSTDAPKVLVVNAFDRVAAPAFIDKEDFAGIATWNGEGVADKYNYGFTGNQYDFDRNSPWLDDDSPGWGASYGNFEGKPIKGNSFDNVILHGQSIMKAGYSFVSVSDEVFECVNYDALSYKVVDIILGEEKTSESYFNQRVNYRIYTPLFMNKLKQITSNKQSVLLSGAYVASDIKLTNDSVASDFAADVLKFKWRSNHAVKTGEVYSSNTFSQVRIAFTFNTTYHPDIYAIEAPDALEPCNGAQTAFRYSENNASAGIAYEGSYKTIVLGFPIETMVNIDERDALVDNLLNFLYKK